MVHPPPADIFNWYIHFTFLYLNCFLHAVYFVHCALSLIILSYICACCDTRCFFLKKGLFILTCRSKSPTGVMLHVVNIRHKIKFLCLWLYIFFWGGGAKYYQLLSLCVDYCRHFIPAELICSISPNIQFEF